jgi:hypothetical protein
MALRRELRLVWLGLLSSLRNPGLRLMAGVGFVGMVVMGWNLGAIAGSTAVLLTTWLAKFYGTAACLWFAYAALRDQDERAGAVIRSKPVDGARWVMLNWVTGMGVWLVLMGACFLGAAVGQLVPAGATALVAHGIGFARAGTTLMIIGTLSFTLSRMLRSPLGGIIVMFVWFCTMAGLRYIPAYLQPDFAQNRPLFLALGLFLLCLCALGVERFRRGELRQPLVAIAAVGVAGVLLFQGSAAAMRARFDADAAEPNIWSRMAMQHMERGMRIPGFWLPDGKGGRIRLAEHRGKILLVFLFAADDLDAARTLPALDRIAKQFGDRGVQPIGICFAADHGDGRALARTGGYGFPIGSDLSTVKTSIPPEAAITSAFDAQVLPTLVLADRRHLVRDVMTLPSYDFAYLQQRVEERLGEEPQ